MRDDAATDPKLPGMNAIEHVVVLMLENRSFDNLLGWTWADGEPSHFVPPSDTTPFQGLTARESNPREATFWNPDSHGYFHGGEFDRLYVQRGTHEVPEAPTAASEVTVPDPDPWERFRHMTYQLSGPETPCQPPLLPRESTEAATESQRTMRGFYLDYLTAACAVQESARETGHSRICDLDTARKVAGQILQTYDSARQLPVLHALARAYAVCDTWHGSCPCQTWPNRAFMATGTANGRVNNGSVKIPGTRDSYIPDPFNWDIDTIFNVFERRGVDWAVFNDSSYPSLTRLQFPKLWSVFLEDHFHSLDTFLSRARHGKLPAYSFVEPEFVGQHDRPPNDMHPPHDVRAGEKLLFDVYSAVAGGEGWDKTMLVVIFDENGGCLDHVTPTCNAVTPDAKSDPGEDDFRFNRFGPRIPALLISPWIEARTVLRPPGDTPFDHTSVLATLRDWKEVPAADFLPSKRIQHAPTLGPVLNRSSPRAELPPIPEPTPEEEWVQVESGKMRSNVLQEALVMASEAARLGRPLRPEEAAALVARTRTPAGARRTLDEILPKAWQERRRAGDGRGRRAALLADLPKLSAEEAEAFARDLQTAREEQAKAEDHDPWES